MNNNSILKFKRLAFLFIASAIFSTTAVADIPGKDNPDRKNFEIVKNLDIFYTLFRELNSYYVDETNPEQLIKSGIDAMLESLDPYTTYIPEEEMDDFRFMTTGEYGGIGALITKRGEYVVISEPYKDFPAQKAGLKAGDRILKVDQFNAKGAETAEVSDKLKGPAGTIVEIVVERPGLKEEQIFEVKREIIQINPVPYYGMLDNKTGIIILNNFTSNCTDVIEKAFTDLKENKGMEQLVLDLRSNPGGLMDEAVKTANLFLPRGSEVVSTKGKISQWDNTYRTPRNPIDTIMPLTVLINRGSASASEIVAGAIQDHDRGIIIGQRSFGKGLVQTTRNLAYNSSLKVTTAKYYIPSGRSIQAVDYAQRDEDGSVELIPDSLMSKFYTSGGRPVYDGGGISPDIIVQPDSYANITIALMAQQTIFDFATKFVTKNESIDKPGIFKIDDETYEQFIAYVKNLEDFTYTSRSNELYRQLKNAAKNEEYYTIDEKAFEEIEELLKPNAERSLDIFSEEVKNLLTMELLTRYYHQEGSILHSIENDEEIHRAVEVLNDSETYQNMLNGTIPTHAGDKRMGGRN
ncbi:S41 family peptidase [Marinilabiliaceae bacterium ANBcel2]|nr:S41 family peptidase [Marinilabiliaceae bacterium ANBcel2]